MTLTQWDRIGYVNSSTDAENDSQIVQLSNGNILVAYATDSSAGAGSPAGYDVLGQIYDVMGNAIGGAIRLNSNWSKDAELSPAVASFSGGIVSVYLDQEVTSVSPIPYIQRDIRFNIFNDSGSVIRGGTIKDAASFPFGLGTPLDPQVAVLSETEAMVVWHDGEDILARSLNPSTGAMGTERVVFNGASGTGEGIKGIDLIANPTTGEYVVAFGNLNNSINDSLQFRRLDEDGINQGVVVTVQNNFDEANDPALTLLEDGRFVVTYVVDNTGGSNTGIRYAIYNDDGTAAGQAQNVPVSTVAGNQLDPEVVALSDGGFAIFWYNEDTLDLVGRHINAAGATVGSEFIVRNYGGTVIPDIQATLLEDGRVAISWTSEFTGSLGDTVEFEIWDPRSTVNDADSNGNVVGTITADTITVASNDVAVYGHDGNDRITIHPAQLIGLDTLSGGDGYDVLAVGGTYGLYDFRGLDLLEGFEEIEFTGGASSPTLVGRTAYFLANQLTDLERLDFYNNFSQQEQLVIQMGTQTTLDLSDVIIQDYVVRDPAVDLIFINGDGSTETITGTTNRDFIAGGAGNDTLHGDGGDDTIRGGAGADSMTGGTGRDVLDYGTSTAAVTVNLQDLTASGGYATGDTFDNGFLGIQGSYYGDVLTGNSYTNELWGRNGDDILEGLNGADTLHGEQGNDIFRYYTNGSVSSGEVIDGGLDYDTVALRAHLGSGNTVHDFRGAQFIGIEELEFASYAAGAEELWIYLNGSQISELGDTLHVDGYNNTTLREQISIFNAQTVDLTGWTFQQWGAQGELINFYGTSGANTLSGSSQVDAIFGNNGNDDLFGAQGDDTIMGGAGDDTVEGGAGADELWGGVSGIASGRDTLSYAASGAGVAVNLSDNTASGGHASGDTISDFQDLIGSAHNDTLTGDGQDNVLNGGEGSDTLSGGAGVDKLYGEDGADTFLYDDVSHVQNDDLVSGGADYDRIRIKGTDPDGDATYDLRQTTISSIEEIEFGSSVLGDYTLEVILSGGQVASLGALHIDGYGNAGNVEQIRVAADGASTVDLSVWTFQQWGGQGDSVILEGNLGGNDTLTGSLADDIIQGNSGDDLIDGAGGDDTLLANAGQDTLTGGQGADLFQWDSRSDIGFGLRDSITDFTVGEDRISLVQIDADEGTAGTQAFTFIGSSLFTGTAGELRYDPITGWLSGDVTGSGSRNFSLVLDGAPTLSTLDLLLRNEIIGDENDNTLIGSGADDMLLANAGHDTLTGGDGADIFFWDDRVDIGFGQRDSITDFTVGEDKIDLSQIDADENTDGVQGFTFIGGDAFSGTAGELQYDAATGWLSGDVTGSGSRNFSIELDAGLALTLADLILGQRHDGTDGDDLLVGGSGNDAFLANAGRDTLTGGDGADVFIWDNRVDIGFGQRDSITDFTVGEDKIDLSHIDADENTAGVQGFTFIGGAAFSGAAGELQYDAATGWLSGDVTGSGSRNFSIELDAGLAFTVDDLILV